MDFIGHNVFVIFPLAFKCKQTPCFSSNLEHYDIKKKRRSSRKERGRVIHTANVLLMSEIVENEVCHTLWG